MGSCRHVSQEVDLWSPKVIEAIPTEERATEIVINGGQAPITKTLGISWNSTEDVLTVTASAVSLEFQITKRKVLRKVATIFDPLGFVCPYVIMAKILLQGLWTDARLRLGRRSSRWNSRQNQGLVGAIEKSARGEDSPVSTTSIACQVEAHCDICWCLSTSLWCSCLYALRIR